MTRQLAIKSANYGSTSQPLGGRRERCGERHAWLPTSATSHVRPRGGLRARHRTCCDVCALPALGVREGERHSTRAGRPAAARRNYQWRHWRARWRPVSSPEATCAGRGVRSRDRDLVSVRRSKGSCHAVQRPSVRRGNPERIGELDGRMRGVERCHPSRSRKMDFGWCRRAASGMDKGSVRWQLAL
jgi:hypothetical protein